MVIVSSVIVLALFAFTVMSRLIYKIRKLSGLSVMFLGCALLCYLILQINYSGDSIYAEVFASQNFVIAIMLLLLSIYLLVMTLIDRQVYKWDQISYGPAIAAALMLPPYYFVGVLGPAIASLAV